MEASAEERDMMKGDKEWRQQRDKATYCYIHHHFPGNKVHHFFTGEQARKNIYKKREMIHFWRKTITNREDKTPSLLPDSLLRHPCMCFGQTNIKGGGDSLFPLLSRFVERHGDEVYHLHLSTSSISCVSGLPSLKEAGRSIIIQEREDKLPFVPTPPSLLPLLLIFYYLYSTV
jgi:hypothetical protein